MTGSESKLKKKKKREEEGKQNGVEEKEGSNIEGSKAKDIEEDIESLGKVLTLLLANQPLSVFSEPKGYKYVFFEPK